MNKGIVFLIVVMLPYLALAEEGEGLYMKHCSSCHHAERYGLKALPLIPETLKRYQRGDIVKIIMDGLPATQMPSYGGILGKQEIDQIVSYITSPVADVKWGLKEIIESREVRKYHLEESGSRKKISNVDPENITLVVESGKGVAVMDGQEFNILDRFEIGAIHGGPKFSHSLRYVYAATRDGIVAKYDLSNLKVIGKLRAGINTRNIAISHDDQHVAVANYLPENITILDGDLNPEKIINVDGRIGGVYLLHNDNRFICSFRNRKELWLIDYGKGFGIERLHLPEPFEDMAISPFDNILIGTSRSGEKVYIYSVKERKVLSSIATNGMPHLVSVTFWLDEKGVPYAAMNNLKTPVVTVIDLKEMKVVKEIRLSGNGYFVRTHQNTPYIWVDTNSEALQIIDKKSLQVVRNLIPAEGKKVMHTEFTKDGRYAMVSLWEDEGAVIIYDAIQLKEVKRIPFRKPAGKYNALNKTFPLIPLNPPSNSPIPPLLKEGKGELGDIGGL